MAGTLTISTLSDGTNSTSSTNCIQGSAKAWGSYSLSGGVFTQRAAYNVSSITYNGTGNFTVNFTNALTDANYSIVATSGQTAITTPVIISQPLAGYAPTASSVTLGSVYANGAAYDGSVLNFSVFR